MAWLLPLLALLLLALHDASADDPPFWTPCGSFPCSDPDTTCVATSMADFVCLNPGDPNPCADACGDARRWLCILDEAATDGHRCEWLSQCIADSCPDGMRCISTPSHPWDCQCPPGTVFSQGIGDQTCVPDPCLSSPCGAGVCWENGPEFTCHCEGSGYSGTFCQDRLHCAADSEGNATWRTTEAGKNTTGSCLPGYIGQPTRTCLLSGTFGPIAGGCILPSCPVAQFADAVWPEVPAGQIAVGTCNPGYRGTPTRRCLPGGRWQNALEDRCQKILCAATTEQGATWSAARPLEMQQGKCLPGTQGRVFRTCLADGTFGPISGTCLADSPCKAEDYARAAWPETTAGVTASGTCEPGFVGNPTRACLPGGTWASALSTHCQRSKCAATIEGNATWAEGQFGDFKHGQCIKPTAGRVLRECLSGGYGPITGTCFPPCPATVTSNASYNETEPGGSAVGTCLQGFTGTPIRKCLRNGTWAALASFPCTEIICPALNDGVASFPRALAGKTSVGRCLGGKVGSITRLCGWSGQLEPAVGSCH